MRPETADTGIRFLSGGGEMGALTRATDWSKTPLGAPGKWPQSLRTTLSILLNSKFPMFLWWGPELICFYNDAYRPSLGQEGKHPSILGQPAAMAWPEIWTIIKPLIDQVLGGGEATWSEDQLIPIFRNGKIEDVYWTFSYSPVNDESGKPAGVFVTCTETTTRKKVEEVIKELRENEERLNIVIDASELGTWELNLRTDEINYSERYLQIFGYEKDASPSHEQVMAQLHPGERAMRDRAFERSFETGAIHYESRVISNDKSIRWMEVNGKLFYDAEKKPFKLIGTIRDITEQKSFARELERQVQDRTKELAAKNRELEKMNTELQSFAYVSSHDLQEPLRKIQTFASLILEKEQGSLSEKGKNYFERMQNAARRMQTLIEDLLAYSRTNVSEQVFQTTDLNGLAAAVKSDLTEALAEKRAVLEYGDLGRADIIPFQFSQLLYNLIGNSLKFAKPGMPPHIRLTSELVNGDELTIAAASPAKSYRRITITDNGIGFDPHYKERIFELFQRLHGKDEYAGTGIGLAIVKKIVGNHNGMIEASGELNGGARFDVYIPVA